MFESRKIEAASFPPSMTEDIKKGLPAFPRYLCTVTQITGGDYKRTVPASVRYL